MELFPFIFRELSRDMEPPCSMCTFPLVQSGYDEYDPGDTVLMFAACNGHTGCIDAWLEAGADVNETNCKGAAALAWAANKGHEDCLETLIKAGAAVNMAEDNGFTALMYAAGDGHDKCVDKLLIAGADVNITTAENETALDLAALCGYDKCVNILIKAGSDVGLHVGTGEGRSALISAAMFSHHRCVDLLLQVGADVNFKPSNGNTALISALLFTEKECEDRMREAKGTDKRSHQKCVNLLIEAGADVNARGMYDTMPLVLAAGKGHYECVVLLLRAGILINKTTHLGHNALAMCIITHGPPNEDVAMLLCAAGETLDSLNDARIPEFLKQQQIQRANLNICAEKQYANICFIWIRTHICSAEFRSYNFLLPSRDAYFIMMSLDR